MPHVPEEPSAAAEIPARIPDGRGAVRHENPAALAGEDRRARLNVLGVHLYLEREDGRILLGRRHPDSAFAGGHYHFLAGHCEMEGAAACAVREAEEEAGLTVSPHDVELVHTVHMVDQGDTQPRIGLVFRVRAWTGEPEVREPDKCVEWVWADPARLPEPIVGYARSAIEAIGHGVPYSELGWSA